LEFTNTPYVKFPSNENRERERGGYGDYRNSAIRSSSNGAAVAAAATGMIGNAGMTGIMIRGGGKSKEKILIFIYLF